MVDTRLFFIAVVIQGHVLLVGVFFWDTVNTMVLSVDDCDFSAAMSGLWMTTQCRSKTKPG